MSRERFLTILVPIRDEDCEATVYANLAALQNAVPASGANTDKIYKVQDGTYYRSAKSAATGLYGYNAVVDREFPHLGDPINIYDFTYDATRMGTAPTISAQNVMRFAENDGEGGDITLEESWTPECHVVFNGEKFYLKQIPTSSKSNEDARYKYDMDFVAERVVLERVYLYDVVQPFVTEKPISESASFGFYGDINELSKRINASLIRSGLCTLTRKYVPYPTVSSRIVPYLTYDQWNQMNVNPSVLIGQGKPFSTEGEMQVFGQSIYSALGGDYNRYLMDYIYENTNGVYTLGGYRCVIGKDKKGEETSSDEKLITFDKNTIHEALQQFHDTFELEYYITRADDGGTLIVVGDCEHDFADWDDEEHDYVRDADGIPTSSTPFDYGVDDELLSKEKTNTTDKIVTRITGVGSSENIPWYYPNPNPDGWLRPMYTTGGVEQTDVDIEYPTSEGSNVVQSVAYEKYLKNRIGVPINRGVVKVLKTVSETSDNNQNGIVNTPNAKFVLVRYRFVTGGISNPSMTLDFSYPIESNCNRFSATLTSGASTVVGEYDSSQTYQNPTEFQSMMAEHNGKSKTALSGAKNTLQMRFYLTSVPLSAEYDYEGYHYPSTTIQIPIVGANYWCYVGENFYQEQGLQPFVEWDILGGTSPIIYDAGYSIDGTPEGKVVPIPRYNGRKYKDVSSGTLYKCTTSNTMHDHLDFWYGTYKDAYESDPTMDWREWLLTYVNMYLRVYDNDGWYIGSKKVELSDYGLGDPERDGTAISPEITDAIEFQRVKYVTPQPNLMPEVYIKTDGERRFYNAHNYWDAENETLYAGTADATIGEVQSGTKVKNPIYKEKETDSDSKHYQFENEYIQQLPHEHIEDFDDVKPTIKEQTNTVEGGVIRIDVVEEFAYDDTDNDEIWESADGGNIQGDYKHPYFFAKLRPMGFNLFDLALQEDMVLSMTTGHCGACNFKIGVDENTKKNPVQLWPYDVYGGPSWSSRGERLHMAGDLRRYTDTSALYYDTTGYADGYLPVNGFNTSESGGFLNQTTGMYDSYVYSSEDVMNGMVGSMRQDGKSHFEGDVVTNGRFIDSQQDTSDNYVWVALMKDTDTYGTIMPSAIPNYADPNFNVYIRPASIADVHVVEDAQNGVDESTNDEDEEKADKFVLLNIRLPQMYLRRAERYLSRKLVAYMYDNNYQKFNFSIKFSSIFLAQNESVDDNVNENSVMYVTFNRKTYRQYVKHYTYTMRHDSPLPEIGVDMNEELSVSRTFMEQQAVNQQNSNVWVAAQIGAMAQQVQERVSRRTVSKTDDVVVSGNIIVRDARASLYEIGMSSAASTQGVEELRTDLEVNHYKRTDFVVTDGTDLNIGGEVFLPTAYNNQQGEIERRKWDRTERRFVIDDTQSFAPAFIDTANNRMVDYMAEYELLETEPDDWDYNWMNYYKLDRGTYEPIEAPVAFEPDTYYKRAIGIVNNTLQMTSALEWEEF